MRRKRGEDAVRLLPGLIGWWRIELSVDEGASWQTGPVEYEDRIEAMSVVSALLK